MIDEGVQDIWTYGNKSICQLEFVILLLDMLAIQKSVVMDGGGFAICRNYKN